MENPWDLLLNTGNHPKGYSSFNKTPFPWLLLLPVPCQDLAVTSLGKGLSSVTNVQALLWAPSLGEVPGWDFKV